MPEGMKAENSQAGGSAENRPVSVPESSREAAAKAGVSSLNRQSVKGAAGKNAPESETARGAASSEKAEAKKQLNVFGPAAFALGLLTVLFAFIAGIKALVLGIPALVVGALGLLACRLLKNVKKRLSVAGLIFSAAGIIIALIIRTGLVI